MLYKKLILYGFVLFVFFSASAQNDTIIIYEDIIVYDTIVQYDTIYIKPDFKKFPPVKLKSLSLLRLDTINKQANILLISGQQTATIPINHIMLNNNINQKIKNSESMKRLSFFGVVCFAFQSMVLAQSDYGISLGSGTWWASCNNSIIKNKRIVTKEISPSFDVGLFYNYHLNSKIYINTSIEYGYLRKNKNYLTSEMIATSMDSPDYYIYWDNTVEYWSGDSLNIITNKISGLKESQTDYHQISIPINIGYNIGRFAPQIGLNYARRFNVNKLNQSYNYFGLNNGVIYSFKDNLNLGIYYQYGLSSDIKNKVNIGECIPTTNQEDITTFEYSLIEAKEVKWKSSSIMIKLLINLNSNKKDKIQ